MRILGLRATRGVFFSISFGTALPLPVGVEVAARLLLLPGWEEASCAFGVSILGRVLRLGVDGPAAVSRPASSSAKLMRA